MNLLKVYIFIIVSIFTQSLLAQVNHEGVFENIESQADMVEGDMFRAKITIMPLQAGIPSEIRNKLEYKTFLNYFLVVSVESIAFSKNNSDVLEIFLTAVVQKNYKPQDFYIWSYKGLNIPFEIRNINISLNSAKNKDYLIHEQDALSLSNIAWYYYFALLIASMFLFKLALVKMTKIKASRLEQKRKKLLFRKWKDLFKQSSERKDYENLVVLNNEWKELLGPSCPKLDEFVFEVNKIMYEREWTDEMLKKIETLFNINRDVFGDKWK